MSNYIYCCKSGDDHLYPDSGSSILTGTIVKGDLFERDGKARFQITEVVKRNNSSRDLINSHNCYPLNGGLWKWKVIVKPTRSILRSISRKAKKQLS